MRATNHATVLVALLAGVIASATPPARAQHVLPPKIPPSLVRADGTVDLGGLFRYGVVPWQDGSVPQPVAPSSGNEGWDGRFGAPGTGDWAWAVHVDGGDVYIGGGFISAGALPAAYIARWSPTRGWAALGGGMSGPVYAIVGTANDLYAGGDFAQADSLTVGHVARWDGGAWHALGAGLNGSVKALLVHDGEVVAGGRFSDAGGLTVSAVAAWDGAQWNALGDGVGGLPVVEVYALASLGQDVIAAGQFATAGGTPAANIARWNGSTWSALDTGIDGPVYAVENMDGELFACGAFSMAGGVNANNIAKWEGGAWNALGSGLNNWAFALESVGNDLYAGGGFTTAGGTPAYALARWHNGAWESPVSEPDGAVYSLTSLGDDVCAAGVFTKAGPLSAKFVALLYNDTWRTLGSGMGPLSSEGYYATYALAADGADIYAAGSFREAAGVNASTVARWDGERWHAMPNTFFEQRILAAGNGNVYTGDYTRAYRWTGTQWQQLGGALPGNVACLAIDENGDLYASGYPFLVRWDGANWISIGDFNASVKTVEPIPGGLVAGGLFTSVDGTPATRVARWDGATWSAMGDGLSSQVLAFAFDGSDIFAGGSFTASGTGPVLRIARWDEPQQRWVSVGGGMDGPVADLTAMNGHVVAGGSFLNAGGVPVNRIAEWDGTTWSAFGGGANATVNAVLYTPDALFAGGFFTRMGDVPSVYFARWAESPTAIPEVPAATVTLLAQNYPNPFNPDTQIRYTVPGPMDVRLAIYDVSGRLVRTLVNQSFHPAARDRTVRWDGRNNGGESVASGVYFCRLVVGGHAETRKMVLLR